MTKFAERMKRFNETTGARCLECTGYIPHDEVEKLRLRNEARQIVAQAGGR